ncbi:hypothetical protein JOD57_002977 [Geodermatophilus bullaregiensis]|nr:hypothetical protein [Geodermatophilus bullaregiensis]MBM7807140.1 hypothetical protein [Geodermatophilus bullaregiensis]
MSARLLLPVLPFAGHVAPMAAPRWTRPVAPRAADLVEEVLLSR